MEKIHILVVDDAAFTRDLIKKGIRSHFPNFKLEDAVDGKQAKNRIRKGGLDLVLCDWEMPEMGGDELLEWLRSPEEASTLPFIMVTSRGDKEHVMRAVELGANNYIVKPFTTDKLIEVMLKVLVKATKKSPKKLAEIGMDAKSGMMNESASVLLGAQGKPNGSQKTMGLSGDLPIAASYKSAEEAQRKTRIAEKVTAQLRIGELVLPCLVREITQEQVLAVIRRESGLPTVLDLAVFDFLNPDGSGEANMNGYIHMLQARDPSQESEFVNIVIRFVDDEEAKKQQLQSYINSIHS